VGLGGKGVVPGRPDDSFGVGWARTQLRSQFIPFLRQRLNLGLDKEDVVEMYYNLHKSLNSSGNLQNMNTSVVGGLRIYSRF